MSYDIPIQWDQKLKTYVCTKMYVDVTQRIEMIIYYIKIFQYPEYPINMI